MKNLRVIFMGTPFIAVPILEYLNQVTNVVLVVTKPDKIVGRKKELQESDIKKKAKELGLNIFQPDKLKNDFEIIKELNPDLIITCAFGEIISEEILNIPKIASLNVHASLLPKYRGAAPIQWAMLNGDEETGVTLMYMDKGMDTGDIIATKSIIINKEDNIETLHNKLGDLGVKILEEYLPRIVDNTAPRIKQDDSKATIARMITREDERIDFNDSCKNIINKIRAFNPWPIANFILDGKEIKVFEASYELKNNINPGIISAIDKHDLGISCKDGIIYLKKIKPFGKKEMDITSFINGLNKEELIGKKVNDD